MGKYSVPEHIRKQKPKGTMVKRIKNGYYVYNYSSKQIAVMDEEGNKHWQTKTTMGECIGLITESDGFVPNDGFVSKDMITGRNYGNYAFALKCSKDTYSKLCSVFHPDDAKQIYSVAIIFFVDGFTHMTSMKDAFDVSYLPILFGKVHLGYDALHTLYRNLGTRSTKVRQFESMMYQNSSKRIAIDGHVIACTSECNDLSEFGYKAAKLGTEQINWLTAYDVVDGLPLFSHMYSGADPDKISVQALFEQYEFSNTEFLVDRGFNTDSDKSLMSSNGNTYIVPMVSNRNDYASVIGRLKFDKRKYFVYNKSNHASMIYYADFMSEDGACRYLAFQDTTRAGAERQDYIKALSSGKKGYTEQGLLENELYFGLFLLETNNLEASAETVFSHYKDRWGIETYYNYVRNDADFNAIYQQDYFCMQGLSFIVTLSGMIYHDVKKIVESSQLSVKEVMRTMKKLKISLEGKKWIVQNNIKSVREAALKVGFEIPKYLSDTVLST